MTALYLMKFILKISFILITTYGKNSVIFFSNLGDQLKMIDVRRHYCQKQILGKHAQKDKL